MQLLQLHSEILQMILEQLTASELVKVHRTCAALHSTSSPLVRRKRLIHIYTYLDFSRRFAGKRGWIHPFDAIDNIRKEPDAAHYVKTIVWDSGQLREGPPKLPNLSQASLKEDDDTSDLGSLYKKLLKADPGICDSDHLHWLNQELMPPWPTLREKPFLTLCIICPQLEVLRINDGLCERATFYLQFFLEFARLHQLPLLTCDTAKSDGLRQLRTLILDVRRDIEDVIWSKFRLLCIPTLRKFGALGLSTVDDYAYRWRVQWDEIEATWSNNVHLFCNLEIVVMVQAYLSPYDLVTCVKAMQNIRSFVYSDADNFQEGEWITHNQPDDIFWDSAESFLGHFLDAYGQSELNERHLRTALRSHNLIEIFREASAINEEWVGILDNDNVSTDDVERYLKSSA